MFGTLRPTLLEGCSRGRYGSSYCGTCHAMAEWGRPWALTAGYDLAFLHLVLAALEGAPEEQARCTALPFKTLSVRRLSPECRRWLAALNFLLMAAKCHDDLADEGGWKARAALRALASKLAPARRVLEESGFDPAVIDTLPKEQAALERGDPLPLERLALPTTRMLGEVFAHTAILVGRPELRPALRQLGQGLGCAIYIRDAEKDYEQDASRNAFNALRRNGERPGGRYARTALAREVRRARVGLERLTLGRDEQVASGVLDALERRAAVPAKSRRAGGGRGGFCEVLLCCDASLCCEAGICCQPEACCYCPSCDCCGSSGSATATASASSVAADVPRQSGLHCPACGDNLFTSTYSGVEIDECHACRGLWLDEGELAALGALSKLPARLLDTKPVVRQLRPEGTRPCPRCSQLLIGTMVKGVRLDLCSECQGLWLDQGELNRVLEA